MASSSFSMKAYTHTHAHTRTHAHTCTPTHTRIPTHTHTQRISAGIVCPIYTGFKTIRSTNAIVHTSFYNVKQCPKTPENIARSLLFKNERVVDGGKMHAHALSHSLIEFSKLVPKAYCPLAFKLAFKCNPLVFKWVSLLIFKLSIK